MSTFITKLDGTGTGPRVAVKDLIDVDGVPTTAGCRAVEATAAPATADAPCLAGIRAADARIVGKTNLHELAMLPIGTNPWFGTPANPFDPALIPGGSSSGSAVAVATDEADVALGTDTGGSVRVPSACCGTVGLKTTYGRIPVGGVWPLSPMLDTVGPMAADVVRTTLGMQLLEPGFTPNDAPTRTIGRIRTEGDPQIEAAIEAALRAAELDVVELDWEGFTLGAQAFATSYFSEVWETDHQLASDHPDEVGEDIKGMLAIAEPSAADTAEIHQVVNAWRASLSGLFEQVELLALPTMPMLPPRIDAINPDTFLSTVIGVTVNVTAVNAAGVPATAQPVPIAGSRIPASLQLVGPLNGEELLLPTAAAVEAAVSG